MNTPEKTVPSRTYRIAVLPGDGIGKEVMPEGLRVTQAAAQRFGQTHNVGLHIFVLTGEHLAGTPHPGLHFVKDHQCAELIAKFTNSG